MLYGYRYGGTPCTYVWVIFLIMCALLFMLKEHIVDFVDNPLFFTKPTQSHTDQQPDAPSRMIAKRRQMPNEFKRYAQNEDGTHMSVWKRLD